MFTVMRFSFVNPYPLVVTGWFACGSLYAQTVPQPLPGPSKVEPGLELAVNWKWWVVPPENKEWGMPLPDALVPKMPGSSTPEVTSTEVRPETYEVMKGDAIIKIAKKFDMTTWQLKQFNELKDDRIRVGQLLRIPTPGQLLTMVPPPPPEPKKEVVGKKKTEKPKREPEPVVDPGESQLQLDNVRLQVFLDREMFSPGVIDGNSGATFLKICEVYQKTHADAANPGLLKMKAEAAVKDPYTRYVLRADDFKFIRPPREKLIETSSAKKKKTTMDQAAPTPRVTIDELVAADFLCYTSAWEFVAERFHCDEAFLHYINQPVKGVAVVGTGFQVPNVIPFEIEKALEQPLQPSADPQKPVTVSVIALSRLEISSEGKLVAVMPLASARPGLHGRGSWTVLDAIPQPRMATKHEPREIPKDKPAPTIEGVPSVQPVIDPPLDREQYLASGPNNPVGVIWINLAKSGSTDPLPYGLHGTSIPARMRLEGIGGLRLTNWDIARVTRLMPAGTALQWKKE